MKKRRCLRGAEGADAAAASEAETAKHPDVTEIKLCFGLLFFFLSMSDTFSTKSTECFIVKVE